MSILKGETGITFGHDLGTVLKNCPEFLTLHPDLILDRKKSFIGWGFDGDDLGNIIRYAPNALLDDNYDDTEAKISYLIARVGADIKIIAESGLLELEIIETAAKHEFLYRRGKIKRQSKKAYAIDKKQFNFKAKKKLIEE